MSNSLDFLSTVWSSLLRVMLDAQRYDADHDGLIENGGVPDQSYDMWNATGPSAYTGMMKKRDFFSFSLTLTLTVRTSDYSTPHTY